MVMKFLQGTNKLLFEKEVLGVWNEHMFRPILLAMPAVFAIAAPALFLGVIYIAPAESFAGIQKFYEFLPGYVQHCSGEQMTYYLFFNIVCPMFFLLNTLLTAALSSSALFGGEKGGGTEETLMLTPLSARQIFRIKIKCSLLFAFLSSLVSFIALVILSAVASILLKMYFFSSLWIVILFVLTPAISVWGTLSMALLARVSENAVSCAQLSGYAALPIILLFTLQLTGLYRLDFIALLLVGGMVAVADGLLWGACLRRFSPDKLAW